LKQTIVLTPKQKEFLLCLINDKFFELNKLKRDAHGDDMEISSIVEDIDKLNDLIVALTRDGLID